MEDASWIRQLFDCIDAMDTEGFLRYIDGDATFRFGGSPPVKGRETIREAVDGFFASIKGLRHKILETWFQDESVICQGEVTYKRTDDNDVTIPFVTIWGMRGRLIREYLIYIDNTPLLTPAT